VASLLKRTLVGAPIATSAEAGERLPKWIALPTFSSDAVSSTAYATEEILFVIVAGSSSLALGLTKLVPISLAVAVLLTIVVISYRQTIFAYPGGGGSYIVSRENLGEIPALVAGSSLLVDYVLTVAVSVAAGVAAMLSMPGLSHLREHRVLLCLAAVVVITLANLRGLRTSGAVFSIPCYLYLASMVGMLGYGLARSAFGDIDPVPFDPSAFEGAREAGGTLSLFLLLRGFSSGAIALTGVEAISNGVPAFRKPAPKNAATTLLLMGLILGILFFATSLLAEQLRPYPSTKQTVLSEMARAVYGEGVLYLVLQVATAAILTLAANTAFADFPRLTSIIARDGFLPRQLGHRGDRLVFSNGIVLLATAAGVLLVAFGGITNALIPLYAVGVFTAFTLSQAGMVRHQRRVRDAGWRRRLAVNAIGTTATGVVLIVIAVTKFTEGAWLPIVLVPILVAALLSVRRRYDRADRSLTVEEAEVRQTLAAPTHEVAVVMVMHVNALAVATLRAAEITRPDRIVALHIHDETVENVLDDKWTGLGLEPPLELIPSPFRTLAPPLLERLEELRTEHEPATITVYLAETVSTHWYDEVLQNRTLVLLRERLVTAGYQVTIVPVRLSTR